MVEKFNIGMKSYSRRGQMFEKTEELKSQISNLKIENERMRRLLEKISLWGCNGQCVELCGTKCPCCMAQEELDKLKR